LEWGQHCPACLAPICHKANKIQPKETTMPSKGLYANIQAKQKRIAAGSKETMRKPGTAGAPTAKAFKAAAKTVKKAKK